MAERVGSISYDVELNTATMIRGQREVDAALGRTAGSLNGLQATLNAATRAIQIYGAAMALVKTATLADETRLLAARVQVAAGSLQAGAAAMVELNSISQRTQTSVAANAATFNRLNQSLIQMGGTQADTLRITELLAKAIKVSGASGVEASSAMLQFGQALGSGKLAGDELRSLLENAPYLMRQLADGLGVPIGALKKMGEEGELTADKVVNALTRATDQINRDFSSFPQTVESAFGALQDAAGRANAKLDDVAGTSAKLTGIIEGLTRFIDSLTGSITGVSGEADALNRKSAIKAWAEGTNTALSYMVDYTDMVWRNVRRIAIAAEGLSTSFGLSLVRDIEGSDKALENMRRRLEAVNNEKSRGAAMRMPDLGQTDSRELARRGRFGGGGSTTLTPPPTPPTTPKPNGGAQPFDSGGYLAGLEAQAADAWTRIGIIEEQAKRRADELLGQRKISAEQHAQAVRLIEANAAQDRQQILFDDATARLEIIAQAGEKEAQARLRAKEMADLLIQGAMSPAERLRLEEAEKLAALEDALAAEYVTREKYELAKQALRESTAAKLKEIEDAEEAKRAAAEARQREGYAQMFDGMAGLVETFAGKQNAAYKALFAASKSFAIADAIIKLNQAAVQAMADPSALTPAQKFANYGMVFAAGANLVSSIRGAAYGGGRQYGGSVSAGSMYRVNETGKSEMFQGSAGQQYFIPGSNGKIVPAGQAAAGGGAAVNFSVNVHNNNGSAVTTQRNGNSVDVFINEAANQIRARSGPLWNAFKTTNVQGRLD